MKQRASLSSSSSSVLAGLLVLFPFALAAAGCGGSVIVDPPSGCDDGETLCGGVCVDLTSDPDNCGSCGNVCLGASCVAGLCGSGTTMGCPPGLALCGVACVDATTDPQNCGGCGIQCPSGVCASASCVSSDCLTCVEYITDANPGNAELCPTSAALYDALASCVCTGACLAQCADNTCTGSDATEACTNCVGDVVNGCGNELNDCANDI